VSELPHLSCVKHNDASMSLVLTNTQSGSIVFNEQVIQPASMFAFFLDALVLC
jgi:hypothetical protein